MKRMILAGLVTCAAILSIQVSAPVANAQGGTSNCAAVLCLTCPEGYVASPTPGNCCRCVKA